MQRLFQLARYLYGHLTWRTFVWLGLLFIATVLEGLTISLIVPIVFDQSTDSVVKKIVVETFQLLNVEYSLTSALLAMVIVFLGKTLTQVALDVYAAHLLARLLVGIKGRTIDGILEADYQFFMARESGYFTNALTVEFNNLTQAVDRFVSSFVFGVVGLIYLVLAFFIAPDMSLVAIVVMGPLYFLIRGPIKKMAAISHRNTDNNSRLQSKIVQVFNGYKYFKATASSLVLQGNLHKIVAQQGQYQFRHQQVSSIVTNGIEFSTFLFVAGIMLYYVSYSGHSLLAAIFILYLFRRGFGITTHGLAMFQDLLRVIGSVAVLQRLDLELSSNRESTSVDGKDPDFSKPLSFVNVTFSYVGAKPVLDGLTMEIPAGSRVALFGPSGVGKSTVATLVTGILRPDKGDILLGDVSLTRLNLSEYRRRIGYVTQECVILNESILDNVTLGKTWPDKGERVHTALERAEALGFVDELPHRELTVLGDHGWQLSAGQRQRITIARELYKDLGLLIIDEGTSALDVRTELEIQANLANLPEPVTVLFITHRVSTLKNADLIYVLKDGNAVGSGTFDEVEHMLSAGELEPM